VDSAYVFDKKTAHTLFNLVSDSVNRGTSTAKRMHAKLYNWIVYKQKSKAKERKIERKINGVIGVYKYLKRPAEALIISKPMTMWQNMAEVLYNLFVI